MGHKSRGSKSGTTGLLTRYFESEFFAALPKTATDSESAVERIEELYGVTLSPPLAALARHVAGADEGRFGAFFPHSTGEFLPARGQNAMEFILEEPFRVPAAFCDALILGSTPEDMWYFSMQNLGATSEVFLYDHEVMSLHPIAASVEAFALLQRVLAEETLAPEAAEALDGQVAFHNDATFEGWNPVPFAPRSATQELLRRAEAVVFELRIAEPYWSPPHPSPAKNVPASTGAVLTELWTSFLTSRDGVLAAQLQQLCDHRATLVRDACSLLEELLRGRREVGHIPDIHALRRV